MKTNVSVTIKKPTVAGTGRYGRTELQYDTVYTGPAMFVPLASTRRKEGTDGTIQLYRLYIAGTVDGINRGHVVELGGKTYAITAWTEAQGEHHTEIDMQLRK